MPEKADFKQQQQQSSLDEGRGLWRKDSWDESVLLREANDEEGDEMPGFFDLDKIKRMRSHTIGGAHMNSKFSSSLSVNPFKSHQPRSPGRYADGSPASEEEDEERDNRDIFQGIEDVDAKKKSRVKGG